MARMRGSVGARRAFAGALAGSLLAPPLLLAVLYPAFPVRTQTDLLWFAPLASCLFPCVIGGLPVLGASLAARGFVGRPLAGRLALCTVVAGLAAGGLSRLAARMTPDLVRAGSGLGIRLCFFEIALPLGAWFAFRSFGRRADLEPPHPEDGAMQGTGDVREDAADAAPPDLG